MKINRTWIFPILLVIGIISLSFYAYNQVITKTILGEAEVKNRIESLFNGKVQSITKKNHQYEVTFSKNDFIYEVLVDEVEGTFHTITLIQAGTIKEETLEEGEKIMIEEPQTVKPLTEQEVIKIATSQFPGEVDEIEFVDTTNGGYYNINIENDEDEATMQIHALTGKILTITYDD